MKRHIPNLFTFGNLFCGFLSIGYIINDDPKNATILIFIAIMLDALDGRIARILGVSNPIGKELDSLSDIVSFGVAPAFLAVHTYFSNYGILGVALAGLFPVFGSYRLARFNITSSEESLRYFKGIPITLAGAIITFLILFSKDISVWVFMLVYYGLAIMMVSTVKVPSFKKVKLPKNSIITTIFLGYMYFILARNHFKKIPEFFYVALIIYIMFIIFRFIKEKEPIRKLKKKGRRKQ